MKTAVALAAGIAGLVLGCATTGKPVATNLYPLGVGSAWQYRVYYGDEEGRPDTVGTRQTNRVTVADTARFSGGDEAAVVVTRVDQPYEAFDTLYVHGAPGRVISARRLDSELRDTILLLPPAAGKSWRRLLGGEHKIEARFIAQESVKVAAGKYLAWRTEETVPGSDLRTLSWYAPGVGLVLMRMRMTQPDGEVMTLNLELESSSVR